jgi:hypothetical protein
VFLKTERQETSVDEVQVMRYLEELTSQRKGLTPFNFFSKELGYICMSNKFEGDF